MAEKEPQKPVELAPDPDEDDLDDLDDVLDEFAAHKIDALPPPPTVSGPGRPPPSQDEDEPEIDDEFAKKLQEEMAELLGAPEMQKQLEEFMRDLGGADPSLSSASGPAARESTGSTTAENKKEQSFQETIRKTMERMQESGEQASAAAASSDSDDILAQMLKEMESGGFDGEGGDEDFSHILMGMMEQLTNKEILYEPMKELNDKFPVWFEENRKSTAVKDLERYDEQYRLVGEIVARFERDGYSDSNTSDREYIVERMQKMQAAGSPPPDLVGDMNAAQEALGEIDAGCPTQ
ncbi:Pex19 protein [Delitschia confertaspora ATCC 74209]|uniref:Pex19 protein n=1 Tax=Delitschia confertaspora ATCC 74209 TaxID=1513339 RepID=A0A9P4JL14_9PLEO|nr:Pex19 protein [Delitschia confertaspora ATCC 74209]